MGEAKAKYSDLLEQIITTLPGDEENAILQRDLAKHLNVSTSVLKKAIRQGRQQGHNIISGIHGYYLTTDKEKINRFLHAMRKQAATRLSSTAAIKRAATNTDIAGQMSLDEISEKGDGK